MLSVGADVQFRIWDPVLVMMVKDLNTATRVTAQNAITKALLRRPLWEIQTEKLRISDQLLVGALPGQRWGLMPGRLCLQGPEQWQITLDLSLLYVQSVTAFEEPVVSVGR